MTLNHDHATLFVAPPLADTEAVVRPPSTVDHGAEAMHRLRQPFAVRGARQPGRSSEPRKYPERH